MRARDKELKKQLKAWFRYLDGGVVRWGSVARGSGRSYGVVVEWVVDLKHFEDTADDSVALQLLREAIDLLRLLLLARPKTIASKVGFSRRQRRLDGDKNASDSNREAWDALVRGAPVELRFSFNAGGINTRMLLRELVSQLTQEPIDRFDDEYLALRQELLDQIKDHTALSTPAVVALAFDSSSFDDFSLLENQDLFLGLTEIAQELRQHNERPQDSSWFCDAHHSPLVVDKIELMLGRLSITHEVMAAAQALMAVGFPVDCKVLDLDLRQISCSEEDLVAFVTAVTHGATRLRITTGFIHTTGGVDPVDARGEDRRVKIVAVFRAIVSAKHVHTVDLSGLLALCSRKINRKQIFHNFVQTLSQGLPHIIGERIHLTNHDGDLVRRVATEYRAAHPSIKLHTKHLELTSFTSESSQALTHFLSAVDDAEEVSITVRSSSSPISTEAQRAIMRFPSLRRLQLNEVSLSTMDLYDPSVQDPQLPSKPALEELTLDKVRLEDLASVQRFVKKLKPPSTSVLATSLRRLHLHPLKELHVDSPTLFNHEALETLGDALETNRVLAYVSLLIDPTDEIMKAHRARLQQHNGHGLPAAQSLRRVKDVKTRNVAFLSTIREGTCEPQSARLGLDASLASLIFDFSAPHVPRRIRSMSDVTATLIELAEEAGIPVPWL